MPSPALADHHWLVGPDSAAAFAEALAGAPGSAALVSRLRKSFSPEQTRLVMEQAELRRKATVKFRRAESMFFTARGLEQCTDEIVAAHKAERMPKGARLVDFCCGIGGDLLALAERGPTLGVDRDPIVVTLAEANLAQRAASQAGDEARTVLSSRVIADDVSPRLLADADAWHIDPDRRVGGSRTTRVELGEPGPEMIGALLAAQPNAAVKLAPAAEPPADWSTMAELEWISRRGECRQLVAWFGSLAKNSGERRATVLRGVDGEVTSRSVLGSGEVMANVAERIGPYVFEPDAAVLAADLTGALAAEHALESLVPRGAYLTGERAVQDLALATFAVDEMLPFDARRVKSLLRERRIGRLEVKQRGTDLDSALVQRQLRVPGEERATLLLARMGSRVMAIVARRMG